MTLRQPLTYLLATIVTCLSSLDVVAESEFEAWKKGRLNEFSEYKTKLDKEFAALLKANWVELQSRKGKPLFKKKKIIEPPVAPKIIKKEAPPKPVMVEVPKPKPLPKLPKPSKPKLVPTKGKRVSVEFFGVALEFPYDESIKPRLPGRIDKDAISDQWARLAKSDYEPLLKQLNISHKELDLNDWAYAVLINKIADKIYPQQSNEQAMFCWFVLIKSGYRARLAYQDHRIYLLLPTRQLIYAAQSMEYKKQKYYLLDFDGGTQPKVSKVFTYDAEYSGSDRLFDMQFPRLMLTGNKDVKKNLVFQYADRKYSISTVNNQYMIDFMRTYPQVHWNVYFNANPANPTRQQLAAQLRPVLKGMNEEEAVNFLLRFVQTSFKYNTDDGQFGYENPLFPEETLFYPASDCEDRSFLFSWLVRELLGLQVVGLLYPGHVATAVHLNMEIQGDSIRYNNKTYWIADPTYINAKIGMAMPKLKNSKVEFLKIGAAL